MYLKRIVSLLLFILSFNFSEAQLIDDSLVVDVSTINESRPIAENTLIFIDKSSRLSVSDVLQKPFIPLTSINYNSKIASDKISFTYYLKIPVTNSDTIAQSVFLYPGAYFEKIELYKFSENLTKLNNTDSLTGYAKFTLQPGEKTFLLLHLKPVKNDFNSFKPSFINSSFIETYKTYVVDYKSELQIFGFILSGVVLMMILFMITNYIINGKKEFLFNTIYSVCMFLLIYFNSVATRSTTHFAKFYFSYLDFFLLVVGTIFYISFLRLFVNAKIKYNKLNKILINGERFIFILFSLFTYLHFFTEGYVLQFYLELIMKFIILAIGLFFIFYSLKQKSRLINYIAAGNAIFVIFSFISLAIIIFKIKSTNIYNSALFYYYLGIVASIVFFLLGLTYKNRKELISGIKEQEALKLAAEKKEFETQIAVYKAQQEERNRISADMHDDLGAGMTTIRLYSELAKAKLAHIPVPEIDKISSSANELLIKMNAIIWSMSSSNDSLGNMIAYIRSYALEYFENTGVNCKIVIPENLPNIEVIGEIRRNVFLVIKEALNNILKHAEATEVKITLKRNDNFLTLYIQDNGKGINLDDLRQFGNGLKNMKKRMNSIDIEFTVENKNGTLITLNRKVKAF